MEGTTEINEAIKPSLLRQIVDAADMLDDEGKKEVLRKIKLQNIAQAARKVDAMLEGNTNDISDKEVAEIISKDRKNRYQ